MREKRENKSKGFNIRFRPKEKEQLKIVAENLCHLSTAELVRFAIREYMEKHGINYVG